MALKTFSMSKTWLVASSSVCPPYTNAERTTALCNLLLGKIDLAGKPPHGRFCKSCSELRVKRRECPRARQALERQLVGRLEPLSSVSRATGRRNDLLTQRGPPTPEGWGALGMLLP